MSITKEVEIQLEEDDIIEELNNNYNQEELVTFVMNLDGAVGSWDFTKALVKKLLQELADNDELEGVDLTSYLPEEEDREEHDEEDDEEEETEEKPSDHSHVYRGGSCWCGAAA